MQKRSVIRIRKDGSIQAESQGIKGKKCLNYLSRLEEIAGAQIVDSKYTKAFYEKTEEVLTETVQNSLHIIGNCKEC